MGFEIVCLALITLKSNTSISRTADPFGFFFSSSCFRVAKVEKNTQSQMSPNSSHGIYRLVQYMSHWNTTEGSAARLHGKKNKKSSFQNGVNTGVPQE
jgi:hypothetical protein